MTASATGPAVPAQPPRTVQLAFWAIIVQVGLSIVGALLLFGAKDYLRKEINKVNADAVAKNKKLPYPDVAHAVSQQPVNALVYAVLIGAVFVLLAVLFRKGRSWARWVVLLADVLTQQLFHVFNFVGDAPVMLRLTLGLSGVAAVAALIALFLPESAQYFRAVRGDTPARGLFGNGMGGGAAGAGRPASPFNLRTLFAPRQPADRSAGSTADRAPKGRTDLTKRAGGQAQDGAEPARGKAKARAAAEPAAPSAPAASRPAGAKSRGKAKGR